MALRLMSLSLLLLESEEQGERASLDLSFSDDEQFGLWVAALRTLIAEAALARKFGFVWPFADLVVAVIGGAHRQGCCELVVTIPLMIALIPAMKVTYINPMLFALEDVFINQWSDPLDADGDGDAATRGPDGSGRRRTLLP